MVFGAYKYTVPFSKKDRRVSYQPNCDATVTQLWLYLQHCSIFLTGRSLYANLHPYK